MANVNQAIVLGYIGDEPKSKEFDNGGKVVNIKVATTERGYTTKDGREVAEKTEWHNIALWRNMAEYALKYAHKGMLVYVQGKMRTRSYDGQDGQKKYIMEIEATDFQILEKPNKATAAQTTATTTTTTVATQQEMSLDVEPVKVRPRLTDADDIDDGLPF